MNKNTPHRIAAGAIVIYNNSILLVEYPEQCLVAPGGAIELHESLHDAAVRECHEETSVVVKSSNLLITEVMTARHFIMQKSWFLCEYVSGVPSLTEESVQEGIIDSNWYSKEMLHERKVFPEILNRMSFEEIENYRGPTMVPSLQNANF